MAIALETAMECLRPLVNTKPWDYVVIWKLGDDPSRFIQWGTCCCSGGNIPEHNVDDNNGGNQCRDEFFKHSIRTTACKKLAQLPSVIPLYSGIHGDVVTSKQPVWTTSVSDNEPTGTQVLVPVAGGLIEFFSSKNVPRDQSIVNYVLDRFGQEFAVAAARIGFKGKLSETPHSYNFPDDWQVHCLNFLPQPNHFSSFEGSSPCSSLSNEHQVHKLDSSSPQSSNPRLTRKKCVASASDKAGTRHREKGPYKSKNLVTERNRRKRIKAGMFALRALVPKISKMDRVATLGDAAEYIEELNETIADYHNQLQAMDEENKCSSAINVKPDLPNHICNKVGGAERTPTEVQVQVNQLGAKDFLLKLVCSHSRGGFTRLMEAVDALGLQVMDVNVTTLNGSMSNVLRVTANKGGIDPKALECMLIQLVN